MRLIQLHKQSVADPKKSEFVVQADLDMFPVSLEFQTWIDWVKDLQTRHTLADGEMWMVCDEFDPHFVRAVPGSIKAVSE